ncbi:MAG: hypothetical protein IKH59_04370 [Bacteroidaceae bacterium]|nr:hypothetical protein [Bacteroidaceae bacterium]
MKRTLMLLIVLLGVVAPAICQETPDLAEKRYWDEGPLTWNDFLVLPMFSDVDRDSYLSWGIRNKVDTLMKGNLRVFHLTTRTHLYKNESWVRNGSNTDKELRYNQLRFDYVEMMRRMHQLTLDSLYLAGNSREEIREAWDAWAPFALASYHVLDSVCSYGAEADSIAKFEQLTQRVIGELDSPRSTFPDVSRWKSVSQMAFHTIFVIPSPTIRQYTTPFVGIGLTFEKWFRRHLLGIEGYTSLFARARGAFPDSGWEPKQGLGFNNYGLYYGYGLVDTDYLRVTPYAGASYTSIGPRDKSSYKDTTIDYGRISGFGPSAGLQIEYKTRRVLTMYPEECKYSENTVCLRLSATRLVSHVSPDGWLYGLTVSMGGISLVP